MIQSAPNFPAHLRIDPDAIIALAGELDLATVKIFDEMLDAAEFSSLRRLALDLERLSFIDLIGLRGVLRLHATCVTQSVALTIKRGPRGVQRLFELTRTDQLLPFAPPRAEDRSDEPPRAKALPRL